MGDVGKPVYAAAVGETSLWLLIILSVVALLALIAAYTTITTRTRAMNRMSSIRDGDGLHE
jgi:hypothetical protein